MPDTLLEALDPRWISSGTRRGVGLSFQCPHCPARIFAFFENPIDGGPPVPGQRAWARAGASFSTVTLRPSVNMVGHWHGYVREGQVLAA